MISANTVTQSMTIFDWQAIRPLFWVGATALLILFFDILLPRGLQKISCVIVGLGGLLGAGILALGQYTTQYAAFGGGFISDGFTIAFEMIVIVAAALSLCLTFSFDRRISPAGVTALLLFSAVGAMIMAGSGNFLVLFLGLELLSIALYALCGFSIGRTGGESAIKYLLLSSTASAIMLYGMALLYGSTASVSFAALAHIPPAPALYATALGLFFVGLAFKLGLVPFHMWVPDVYEGAPLPVTAFMSVVTKAGALAVLARIIYAALPAGYEPELTAPLWVLAAASIVVGNFGALSQTRLKRLLGYSGIAQMGYIVAALAGATAYGLQYAIFYLAAYMFMNLGAFAVVALIDSEGEEEGRIARFAGLAERNPMAAAALTLFLVGLAGLPPTVGFTGKFLLLASTVTAGYAWLGGFIIFGTAISIYAYFKVIRAMYSPVRRDTSSFVSAGSSKSSLPWAAITVCAVAVLVLCFYPKLPHAVLPTVR